MSIKFKQLINPLLLLLFVLCQVTVHAQTRVSGKVTDNTGKPVTGATITVKGSNVATTSGDDGSYQISLPAGSTTLVISSVGFQTVEVNASSGTANVTLVEVTNNLNEVVVTGYSSQRRKDITGSVAVVKVSDLTSIPASSAENQLQGRAAGVTVVSNSAPGQVSKVRIRGYASFTGNDPLYIVDGVPTGSINGINPDDIESMQVLKDAASASIYGSRASNGVIILTTKRGRSGKARVSYSGYYGLQFPGKGYSEKLLNPQEQADLLWLATKNSTGGTPSSVQYGNGATPRLPDYILAGTFSGVMEGDPAANPALYDLNYANLGDASYIPYLIVKANKQGTNWWNQVTQTAPIIDQNINISGGTADKSRYLFSLNYFNQDGIVVENFYRRYTARMNTEFAVGRHIRIGENLQILFSDANTADNNTEASTIALSRDILSIIPVYTIKEGDFAGTKGNGLGTADNPYAIRKRNAQNRNQNFNIFGNVYTEIDFFRNFTFRSSFGGGYGNFNSRAYPTIEYEGAENARNPRLTTTFSRSRSWTWTNQVTYKQSFGDHDIMALAGTEAVEELAESLTGSRDNFFIYNNYDYITTNTGASNQLSSGGMGQPSALFSIYGKVDYAFKNKYLASFTIRRDGSSRFGSDNRYAIFPSGSLGWRVSEEAFLRDVKWINDLKIRGSYGTMGNQRIDPANQYTRFVNSNGAANYDLNGTSTSTLTGFYLQFIGNQKGKWETNITTNIGFDATLFNGNTDISFDWYAKKTQDLLFQVEQLATSGGTASGNPPFINIASMKNTGVDLSVTQRAWFGAKGSGVRFEGTLTFTTYKNEITKIADGVTFFDYNSPLNEQNRISGVFTRNAVGHPMNSFYGYKVLGIFQNADEVAKAPTQTDKAPGRLRYQDTNGDGAITPDDRVFYGNPNPKFSYGLNLAFTYKGFDLTAFFYGVQGRDVINYSKFGLDFYQSSLGNKLKSTLYESWLPDGSRPNAKIPMQELTSTFSSNANPTSYYMEDGSYLRLRNLSLGYTLPQNLTSKVRIDRVRFYVQAVNLFTITKYTGLDPEIISTDDRAAFIDASTYPAVKQIIFGANINF
ncbi:TonB-dependent receptor [Pollutibacter soli]|uniref:SusC/RagA family TonB-linked outer membrane protein n=1 Tax=Pollutibacter soli TaxID=3034157 RepID=UPI0030136EED